jgi:small subunit ribosomal protein S17
MVRIVECAPISKRKTWTLVERNGAIVGGADAVATHIAETHAAPPAPAPTA